MVQLHWRLLQRRLQLVPTPELLCNYRKLLKTHSRRKEKKKKQPPPCLLHFDDNPKYCTCICYNFDLENRVKYEKKRLQWIHTFDLTRGNAPVKIYILSISQSVPAERERELLNICSQSV